eukprot:gb/GEZN01009256.1/.p1 GENE.gb/GEZN01009256.1/~~gb/GEZN01009256.1/.p1  ORF type:complete len:436 (+),score=41.34 gb/GEZN01009256.1/:31-1338(+)
MLDPTVRAFLLAISGVVVWYVSRSPMLLNITLSLTAASVGFQLIPAFRESFITAHLFGIDLNKKTGEKVAEAQGVVVAALFLMVMFLFIPFPFAASWTNRRESFPFPQLMEFLASLLSICCMIFLGFADDVLNLRWRHKLILPTLASIPLLMVYWLNIGRTSVMVPLPLQPLFGEWIDLGFLYYAYMGSLAVFCTNAINILAGINGVEVGQSMVIGASIIINNIIQLSGDHTHHHRFSLYLMVPFLIVSSPLLYYNWYPSKVFVGDTYCYFAGMTFSVVGILGHFSKTMLLFFIPQVLNFVYSLPQLFRLIPCPRHRMPKYNPDTGLLETSKAVFAIAELPTAGKVVFKVLTRLRLVEVVTLPCEESNKEGKNKKTTEPKVAMSNLTLINFILILVGPTHEARLTWYVLVLQVLCNVFGFWIRYGAAGWIYKEVS